MFWRQSKKNSAQAARSEISLAPGGGSAANADAIAVPSSDGDLSESGRRTVQAQKVSGAYVVPAGYRITGPVFTIARPIRVDGELLGRALVARDVLVSRGGTLREPAEVDTITIEGRVIGPIRARGVVDLRAGGELQGDVDAAALTVSPGGILSNCRLSVGERR